MCYLKMKTAIMLLIFFLCMFNAKAQNADSSYKEYVKQAVSLYKSKDYKHAAIDYTKAFSFFGNKAYPDDRYNAGRCWALAGVPDSAFYHLSHLIAKSKYKDYGKISNDTNLRSLYLDKRWDSLMKIVKSNKYEAEKNLNRPLMQLLDTILINDSKYRFLHDDTLKTYGQNSKQMKALWKIINRYDSIDQVKVCAILDKYGWLGKDVVGDSGNTALFLVVQHADTTIKIKYLPMLKEAVKKGNAESSQLAYIEDRILICRGKKQIYGSQLSFNDSLRVYELWPIEDESNVNKRRAEVGLGKLEDYVKQFGIDYKLPEK